MASEQSGIGGGNIQTPPSNPVKTEYQSVKYVMTWNNYPDDVYEQIERHLVPLCTKYIFAKEIGEKGTHHIQGAFILFKKMRAKTIQKYFDVSFFLEGMKGQWVKNMIYCSKGGSFISNCRVPRPVAKVTFDMLRPDQQKIVNLFGDVEDPLFGRKVHWFWEKKGGWGKTILTKYFIDSHKLSCMTIASKSNDAFYQIASFVEEHGEGPDVIICDIPRSSLDYINYQAIEKIKDGVFSSGKYEGCEVRINSPWIICFANQMPKRKELSQDRWVIEELTRGDPCDEEEKQ